jgi:hypothetical protein
MWRLASATRIDKLATYIVIDVGQLQGISWNQLGDYVAMVALANPKLSDTYPPASSALSLFADRDAGRSMVAGRTAFDRSLLYALYHGDQNQSARLQVRQMVSSIAHQRGGGGGGGKEEAR